ncbi:YggS family pyridoxal phosphate-dependent enzyme [Chloroflexota bacterium]
MINQRVSDILHELPDGVELVAAAKTRQPEEILRAIDAGVKIVGENYVQEAERAYEIIGNKVKWHFIGHLQRNKATKAVRLFDIIETIDSIDIAWEIDKKCAQIGKIMPILVEVNSGREPRKTGVFPEAVETLVKELSDLPNIRVKGLMTMGPSFGSPKDLRPYFSATKKIFECLKKHNLSNVEMTYLSMGMSNSYHIAIEEGANIVRIGNKIFGNRE